MTFRVDAGETAVLQLSTLDMVYDQLTQLYQPRAYRSVIRPGRSVPSWVENIQINRIESTASLELANFVRSGDSIPLAKFRAESGVHKLYHGITGYEVLAEENQRIAQLGPALAINPIVVKANACQTAWDIQLDAIAAGATWRGVTFSGLLTQTANASLTAGQVRLLTAAVKSGSDTEWTTSGVTAAQIASDLGTLADQVYTDSEGTQQCVSITLDPGRYKIAAKTMSAYAETSALELFRRTHPGVAVKQWFACEEADAAGTGPRAVAQSSGPGSPEFVEPQRLTPGRPSEQLNGYIVPMMFTVVGTVVEDERTLCYMDGI